jgi:uncharacterized protein (TIGR03000 family)
MRIMSCAIGIVVVVAGFASAQEKKIATIKILLPEAGYKESELKVEGIVTTTTGSVRSFTTPLLETGRTYIYQFVATIEPNNYTKFIRKRELTFCAGENLTLDLRKKDEKFPDDVRIRWVPTPREIVLEMGKLARIGKKDVVCDLGCGDAIMVITAVKELGAKKGIGIDIDPVQLEAANARVRAAGLSDRIVIRCGNVLDVTSDQIDDASVVMLYMGDEINLRLRPKLWQMLKPGARIVSHRFAMGDWMPDKSITVKDRLGDEYDLHLWIVTGKEKDGSYNKKEE